MRTFCLHWAKTTRFLIARPLAWLVLLAGVVMYFPSNLALGYFGRLEELESLPRATESAGVVTLALLWLMLLAAVAPSAQRTPDGRADWGLPALPISGRKRVLAEVVAAIGLVILARHVASMVWTWAFLRRDLLVGQHAGDAWLHQARLFAPPATAYLLAAFLPLAERHPRPGRLARALGSRRVGWGLVVAIVAIVAADPVSWLALFTGRLWYLLTGDLVIGLPILAAWMADRRVLWIYEARILAAYGAAFLLVLVGLTTHTLFVLVPLGSIALLAVVLFSIGREPSWIPGHASPQRAPRLRARHAVGSAADRFRYDAWLRSSALFGLVVLPCVAAIAVVPALTRITQSLGWFYVVPVGCAVMGTAAFYPLGLALLGWRESPFSTSYCRAWSWLPVKPENVRRAVYVHGLGIVLAFQVSLGVAFWLKGRIVELGERMHETSVETLITWVLVALGWAGYTAAAAIGDRIRSVVSMTGVVLALACLVAALSFGPRAIHVALAAGAVAAVVPLGHLRRPRRMA